MQLSKHFLPQDGFSFECSFSGDKGLLLFSLGGAKLSLNNYLCKPRSAFFIICNSGDFISMTFPKDKTPVYFIEFETSEIPVNSFEFTEKVNICGNKKVLLSWLLRLERIYNRKAPMWELHSRAVLMELFCALFYDTKKESPTRRILSEMCDEIHGRFTDGKIDTAKYADALNISKDRLSVIFSESYGYPPYKYQLMLRMREALFLLKHTDLSIAQISNRLNFSSPLYFSSAFKKQMKINPRNARKGLMD